MKLSPTEAAKIAEGVYPIRKDGDWNRIKSTNQTFIDETLKISQLGNGPSYHDMLSSCFFLLKFMHPVESI